MRQERLEAPLIEHWGEKDLGKVVSLELADNHGSDGIELKYLPEGNKINFLSCLIHKYKRKSRDFIHS